MTRKVKIILFDMDGVLTRIHSSWEYLHSYFGVTEESKQVMKMFMEGKFDYVEWMRKDTELWLGKKDRIHISELTRVLEKVELHPSVETVGRELHKRGIIVGVVSGGIDLLAGRVARILGADVWVANKLLFDKRGYLIPGGVPLVGVDKTMAVKRILGEYNVDPSHAMFVGDSMWDKGAMKLVGYPVAYGDKCNLLEEVARCRLKDLEEVIGLVDEIEETGWCPSYELRTRLSL